MKMETALYATLYGKEIRLGQTRRHTLDRKVIESHPQR
jgi:hypothetical protein